MTLATAHSVGPAWSRGWQHGWSRCASRATLGAERPPEQCCEITVLLSQHTPAARPPTCHGRAGGACAAGGGVHLGAIAHTEVGVSQRPDIAG